MQQITNPWRGTGITMTGVPMPSIDAQASQDLLSRCPVASETPLVEVPGFGPRLWVKDERDRMGLGSFKALGAAYVIAHAAAATGAEELSDALGKQTFVTASAGNHGMSVAAGARVFGARAVIYLAETVPESFAARLREKGAQVVVEGADYEASMAAAARAARENGWTLLSDSSWEGYFDLPHRLMEGYLAMAAEATRQMPETPTHIFLQAGVGGLAASAAAHFRQVWGNDPKIVVVEPEAAPALQASIAMGAPVVAQGPTSNMGRLDCKEPSLIALNGLARDADVFLTISDAEAAAILPRLAAAGLETSESGGAGLAACHLCALGPEARALCILSEGPAG